MIDTESEPGSYEDHSTFIKRCNRINVNLSVPESTVLEILMEENARLTKEVKRLKSVLIFSRDRFVRAGMSTHEINFTLGNEKA
jgi:hypothetical protein